MSFRAFYSKYIRVLNFKQKITYSMITVIILTSLLNLSFFTLYAQRNLRERSIDSMNEQMQVASFNVFRTFNNYNSTASEIASNSWVQAFLRTAKGTSWNFTLYERSANEALDNQLLANEASSFISLLKYRDNQFLYTGETWTRPDVQAELLLLYEQGTPLYSGSMEYTLAPSLFVEGEYSFYFFVPVFDNLRLNDEIGLLTLCMPETELRLSYNASTSDTLSLSLLSGSGQILSSASGEQITEASGLETSLRQSGGEISSPDREMTILHRKIPAPDWYLVGTISNRNLLQDYRGLLSAFVLIILFSIFIAMVLIYSIVRSLYRPLASLIEHIDRVSSGDLEVQFPEERSSGDFRQMSASFNDMVRQIKNLMERVKTEQRQADLTKMNMLQSQIQPHFLYNMLDSIRWQAIYNKDKEVADMLYTFASYYRRSLSKGNDVISLREEIAMVEDYLTLQNMRYDNLVTLHVDIPPDWLDLPIPKITLQPLIENSIYHGFRSKNQRDGEIFISTAEAGSDIALLVQDNGKGLHHEEVEDLNRSLDKLEEHVGYGLRNVHKRLQIYFGPEYGLTLDRNDTNGTTVKILLPKQKK
ncbi:MAG: sensor histidine kinase [Clostridiaceae bacterium]|nr:sensor histidine kinase [Clostridiaceae bacterium]